MRTIQEIQADIDAISEKIRPLGEQRAVLERELRTAKYTVKVGDTVRHQRTGIKYRVTRVNGVGLIDGLRIKKDGMPSAVPCYIGGHDQVDIL